MKNKSLFVWLGIASIIVLGIFLYLFVMYILYPINYKDEIKKYSQEYNLKTEFVASLINAESGYNPNAISNKGAVGLMQIMPSTAEWIANNIGAEYNPEYLKKPEYNIRLGCYYLRYLTDKFKDDVVVLCAYNAGEGVVKSWLNDKSYSSDGKKLDEIPYVSTKNYVKKILSSISVYQKKLK